MDDRSISLEDTSNKKMSPGIFNHTCPPWNGHLFHMWRSPKNVYGTLKNKIIYMWIQNINRISRSKWTW